MKEPKSILTRVRPDIWERMLAMAHNLTGMNYPAKDDVEVIQACGYSYYTPPKPKTPQELEREKRERTRREIEEISHDIDEKRSDIDEKRSDIDEKRREIEDLEKEIEDLDRRKKELEDSLDASARVPEGAVEWVLHEVGHWLAATPEERLLPNYGLTDEIAGVEDGFQRIVVPSSGVLYEREWVAWAFEEIVFAPWGASRSFAPPTQRGGVAYAKAGPVPDWAMREAALAIVRESVDVEEYRSVIGDWILFEKTLSIPAWERVQ